jgi:hypothetical protein
LICCCSVGVVSHCPLAKLDAVDILKVKPSLKHTLPRRHTPRKRAAHRTDIVQALDISGDMVLPNFLIGELFHPLAGRKSQVVQVNRTVPSSGKRPPPKTMQIHPFGQISLSCIRNVKCWSRRRKSEIAYISGIPPRPATGQWHFSGSKPGRKATSVFY